MDQTAACSKRHGGIHQLGRHAQAGVLPRRKQCWEAGNAEKRAPHHVQVGGQHPQLGCREGVRTSGAHEIRRVAVPMGVSCIIRAATELLPSNHAPASFDCRLTILPAPSSPLAALDTRSDLRYSASTSSTCRH